MSTDSNQGSNNGSTASSSPANTSEKKPARDEKGRLLPGNTANPNGRPPVVSITAAIRRKLDEKFPKRECFCSCHNQLKPSETGDCVDCRQFHEAQKNYAEQKTYLEALIEGIFHNAIVRNSGSSQDKVWAYIDGLPKGTIGVEFDRENLADLTSFMKGLAQPKQ